MELFIYFKDIISSRKIKKVKHILIKDNKILIYFYDEKGEFDTFETSLSKLNEVSIWGD